MLRHCVMFRWNDDATDEAKTAIAAGLDQLAQMDVVSDYRHGPDAGISEGNWDYVIVGDFASVDDYRAYATDEGHVTFIADLIRPNISARAGVQYEL